MLAPRLAAPQSARRWLSRAWPGQCEICRQWCAGALCGACIAQFAAPVPRCGLCGLRLGLPARACGRCVRQVPSQEGTVCAVDYAFPWDRLLGAFKFNDRPELATALAGRLLAAVRRAGLPTPDIVVPVPLAVPRLASRGYNQSWELARPVADGLTVRADAQLLTRPLQTSPQAQLDRHQRLLNLNGAFMVDPRRRKDLQGLRVALVDDVMTTGATVQEATATLRRAGAAAVQVWVVARTPES